MNRIVRVVAESPGLAMDKLFEIEPDYKKHNILASGYFIEFEIFEIEEANNATTE